MSDEPRIVTEVQGHVLIIKINRPEAKNAFDRLSAEQMEAAMDRLDDTPELFAGIITGVGGTFSAGADVRAAARGENATTERRGGFGIFRRPSRKPLVAAVEGYAVGGGMELCLSCDLVVAAETAKFGLPEVRHNLVAIGGGLFRLHKRIPYSVAMEMALTGELRDARFLYEWGFVTRLCPHGAALQVALELVESFTNNGPTALAAAKEIMFQSLSWSTEEEAWERQMPIAELALSSEDFKEGVSAFLEKRRTKWRGV